MNLDASGVVSFRRRIDVFACICVFFACVITIFGWQLLWFLTDDAFISFRYASNWVFWGGPTWNLPPFQPVEGYSNFSWVALLSLVWKVMGVEPPEIANSISLVFGLGTLLLSARWLWLLLLSDGVQKLVAQRRAIFVIALLLICTNKSFLTWLSSGLETSLSTFLWVWWAYVISSKAWQNESSAQWQAALSASLLALTRPDGLLVWGLTIGWFLYGFLIGSSRGRSVSKRDVIAVVFLLMTPLHVLWRFNYYHDWLPNTYYAKVGDAWPEMGLIYLLSYFIEYAIYIPLLLLFCCAGYFLYKRLKFNFSIGTLTVLVALSIQAAYYGLIVGGDHFEYRILHQFVPLTVIFTCSLLMYVGFNKWQAIVFLLLWLVLQSIIPWQHWSLSKNLNSREQTLRMIVPVTASLPNALHPLTKKWDELQAVMINHSVGMRHQEHKIFYLWWRAIFPSRHAGLQMKWSDRNVVAQGSVGVPGWVFPNAAIIDTLALNDRVLAKTEPKIIFGERQMAHSLNASLKYVTCYNANFQWDRNDAFNILAGKFLKSPVSMKEPDGAFNIKAIFIERDISSLDDEISLCQTRHWDSQDLYAAPFSGK